jgi:hypothetical protein
MESSQLLAQATKAKAASDRAIKTAEKLLEDIKKANSR